MDDDFEEPAVAEVAHARLSFPSTAELVRMRSALKDAVERIRAAEDQFYATHGVWLDCGAESEARARMSLVAATFAPDGCWSTLGVNLGSIVGGFYVVVDARGYRVHGLLDSDLDGQPAKVQATETLPATWVTPVTVR